MLRFLIVVLGPKVYVLPLPCCSCYLPLITVTGKICISFILTVTSEQNTVLSPSLIKIALKKWEVLYYLVQWHCAPKSSIRFTAWIADSKQHLLTPPLATEKDCLGTYNSNRSYLHVNYSGKLQFSLYFSIKLCLHPTSVYYS